MSIKDQALIAWFTSYKRINTLMMHIFVRLEIYSEIRRGTIQVFNICLYVSGLSKTVQKQRVVCKTSTACISEVKSSKD